MALYRDNLKPSMIIKLLCVGKLKESCLQAVMTDYLTRIRRYTTIDYLEIKAEKRRKTENDEQVKQREHEKLCKVITTQDVVIALDEHGRQYSSFEFAQCIAGYQTRGDVKQLVFVTGGATGFSCEFLRQADKTMSLSRMTFPHQLCRLIFAEQLYRAYTILAGESYHNT